MDDLFGVQLEWVARRYLALLQTHIGDALTKVAGFWADAGGPLALPDVAEWYVGQIPDGSLFQIVQTWPAITVEAVGERGNSGGSTLAAIDPLVVTVYTIGATPEEAYKLTNRYGMAVATVLALYKPAGVKSVGPLAVEVAETVDLPRANFFKGARISTSLQVGALL